MNAYEDYLNEIEERKKQDLHPKPIDDAGLLSVIIDPLANLRYPKSQPSSRSSNFLT